MIDTELQLDCSFLGDGFGRLHSIGGAHSVASLRISKTTRGSRAADVANEGGSWESMASGSTPAVFLGWRWVSIFSPKKCRQLNAADCGVKRLLRGLVLMTGGQLGDRNTRET
ncbi:MAG: hypothetical protein GZ089_02520 [Aromatoleum sp.]|nr:hypothetical protein [Aromatoleum sp.]